MQEQQTQEKDNLTQKFDDPAFKEDMKTALGCSDSELVKIKGEMLKTLENSQKEELQKFEKSVNDEINKLHKTAADEMERIHYLGDRYLRGGKMREEIDRLAAENNKNANKPVSMSIGANGRVGLAILKGIDPKKLENIETISGNKVIKGANDSLTVELNRLFQTDNSIYEELTSLAQSIRAQGHTAITLNVNLEGKDPKRAESIARKAYESAIMAGFDPKKITIQINGENKFKYDDKGKLDDKSTLFKEHPARLKFAENKAAEIDKNRKKVTEGTSNAAEIKAELQKMKQAVAVPDQGEPAPDAQNRAGMNG